MRRIAFAVGIMGLASAPLASGAQVIAAPSCGGGTHLLVLPADPAAPRRDDNCAKACHAATERRGKSTDGKRDCC